MKTMIAELRSLRTLTLLNCLGLAFSVLLLTAASTFAQGLPGTENGEWRYLGGNAGHTRSSPLVQINADNFEDLEQAWIWRGDNFGPNVDYFNRSTPIYVDGMLYTVASPRRQVIAIVAAPTGKYLGEFGLRFLSMPEYNPIRWRVATLSAFVGTYSHVFIDAIMHSDIRPFAPISNQRALHGIVSIETLQLLCVGSALLGGFAFVLIERGRKPKENVE